LLASDHALLRAIARLALAGLVLAVALWLASPGVASAYSGLKSFRDEAALATLAGIGAAVYVAILLALFGQEWLGRLRRT
jgi:putative peptidoglycan lipid II flippase